MANDNIDNYFKKREEGHLLLETITDFYHTQQKHPQFENIMNTYMIEFLKLVRTPGCDKQDILSRTFDYVVNNKPEIVYNQSNIITQTELIPIEKDTRKLYH